MPDRLEIQTVSRFQGGAKSTRTGWAVVAFLSCFLCSAYLEAQEVSPMAAEQAVVMPALEKPADVRLLIDVSGSMKLNDPNNLRQPAVDLLVKLLPKDSKAGVWTFGQYVNMLIPHRKTEDGWREKASQNAAQINSVGLYTNIGEALEKASYDNGRRDSAYDSHLILMTDGMVDIDKNPDINQGEWRRIVDEVLPKLVEGGYTVHTIALSDNADTDLLQQLSRATDGHSAVARSADELMQAFLQTFNKAAPVEELPFDGESFLVDSSVEEFTALIFYEPQQKPTEILAPDGSRYTAKGHDDSVSWFAGDGYDLVTVQQPFEGEWGVDANVSANSRITVISDLSLNVKHLANNLSPGDVAELVLQLRENGKAVTSADFLQLLDIRAELSLQGAVAKRWDYRLYRAGAALPDDGMFRQTLDEFDQQGQYYLSVVVDGKSFQRSYRHSFNIQPPFNAHLEEGEGEMGESGYILSVSGASSAINLEATEVTALVTEPDGTQRQVTLELGDRNQWQSFYGANEHGLYQFEVVVSGEYSSGQHLRHNLPPLSLALDGNSAVISAEPLSLADPEPQAEEPEPLDEEAEDEQEAEVSAPEPAEDSNWLLYVLLGVGNLLVVGLLYFAYRVFVAEPSDEDDEEEEEDEFIDVNAVVDESELPDDEAAAEEAPEQDAPAEEEAPASTEEPAEEAVSQATESEDAATEEPAVGQDDIASILDEMGDPDDAGLGDDILAMDDLDSDGTAADEGGEPVPEPEPASEPEPEMEPASVLEAELDGDLEGEVESEAEEEPPILNEAIDVGGESEPPAAEEQEKPEVDINDEIDALLDAGAPGEEEGDWAAELESSLNAADEAAGGVPLAESFDLADDSVTDVDLNQLAGAGGDAAEVIEEESDKK